MSKRWSGQSCFLRPSGSAAWCPAIALYSAMCQTARWPRSPGCLKPSMPRRIGLQPRRTPRQSSPSLRPCAWKAAERVARKVGETLAYYSFPSNHWRSIREIGSRTRGVGASPMANRPCCWSQPGSGILPQPKGQAALSRHGNAVDPCQAKSSCLRIRSAPPPKDKV
jgi:hypothetical protein